MTENQDQTEQDPTERDRMEPEELLEEVRTLVEELEPEKDRGRKVRLDSSLGSDLGIDSLGRAELLQRLEDRFSVTLSERVMTEAESPRDLLRAVRSASPGARTGEIDLERREVRTGEERGSEAREPEDAKTLVEVLAWHAEDHPDRRHVLFLEEGPGEGEERDLSYGDLLDRGRGAAAAFQELGLDPGQSVGLMLPSGLDYFAAFFGILLAGGVPVPLYPPMRRSQIEEHLKRQAGILKNARVRFLVAFEEVQTLTKLVKAQVPDLERILVTSDLEGDPEAARPVQIAGDDTAFLQYTSGSTGSPKGVILTHSNLLANLRSMGEILDLGPEEVVVSWLPLYHDRGLIGAWMGSLYFGMPLVLMSPLSFLSRPVRWLRAIHRYQGTISAAPNFAYELCLKKIDEGELEDLDLSSWWIALNGAEPVSPRSVEVFTERLAPYGFSPEAMMPVYGLAENSLAVAFTPPDRAPKIDEIRREAFQKERRAETVGEEDENPLRFVSCGTPIPHHEVRIVDRETRELPEREEGRIQFRGPSATTGYFRNPEDTDRLMVDGDWRDSEDLGYMAEGELYVTGRVKDVIIRAGRNIYPQEVEEAVGGLDGVREGCVAVFAVPEEESGTERLVVMAESRLEDEEAKEELKERIDGTTMDLVGTDPDRVVLVPPRTVPKTSSGKIRRSAAKELFEKGKLDAGGRAVWWQVARLALSGLGPQLRQTRRRLVGLAYAGWFWGLFALVAVPVWLIVFALPSRSLRRRFVRSVARAMAVLTGTAIDRRGGEELEETGEARVIASNHASYLDGFVLATALPPRAAYVVKGELLENPFTRIFLSRLGCVFVERFDPGKGEEESEKAVRALERGDHLVLFPEGTLQRAPGLMPFRMGAFVVAARTGTPVVPVVIRGTRSKLRGGSWFPRPGNVQVRIRPEIEPGGDEWKDAVELRKKVRTEMLDHLPEPDLEDRGSWLQELRDED
ncbi:MAG: AMP-binding protein [Thermoanaerobaculia bacterium]|nr:AMP-binding protein [Thermoanaerobaculia bacterium]